VTVLFVQNLNVSRGVSLADKIGRKRCMLLNNVPILLGTVLMAVGLNKYLFIIGRIIAGFGCG
jgi:MFS family permease